MIDVGRSSLEVVELFPDMGPWNLTAEKASRALHIHASFPPDLDPMDMASRAQHMHASFLFDLDGRCDVTSCDSPA